MHCRRGAAADIANGMRVVIGNVLSLLAASRLEEIDAEARGMDVVILVGTRGPPDNGAGGGVL